MLSRALLLLSLLLVAWPAFAQPVAGPVTYRLDPRRSWVYVVVRNDPAGLASGFGHDHGIRAMDFAGTVVWDATDLSKCVVEISFPVTVLEPDPPGMRERANLDPEGAVDRDDLAKIKENFLSDRQLDAARYPSMSYRATSCSPGAAGKVQVTGVLHIRGTAKTVTTHMVVTPTPTSFAASGTFRARATDFGFKPYSNFGVLKNEDEMEFVVDVVGVPAP
jgi:polyisoprenoid-binding protein YceI